MDIKYQLIYYKLKFDQKIKSKNTNKVDGDNIPCRHFGIILGQIEWNKLSKKLLLKKIDFILEPNTRFKGKVGEQSTFLLKIQVIMY